MRFIFQCMCKRACVREQGRKKACCWLGFFLLLILTKDRSPFRPSLPFAFLWNPMRSYTHSMVCNRMRNKISTIRTKRETVCCTFFLCTELKSTQSSNTNEPFFVRRRTNIVICAMVFGLSSMYVCIVRTIKCNTYALLIQAKTVLLHKNAAFSAFPKEKKKT